MPVGRQRTSGERRKGNGAKGSDPFAGPGIETSFRQMRQARIYTCTRNPRLRLFFLALALILRNLWVWIHHTCLAEGSGDTLTLHLEWLRFNRMLDWIVREIVALFHDGSIPCVIQPP
jgi:hypothetical protein